MVLLDQGAVGRLLDRKIERLGALQYQVDVGGGAPYGHQEYQPHKSSDRHVMSAVIKPLAISPQYELLHVMMVLLTQPF